MSEAGYQSYSLTPTGDMLASYPTVRHALDWVHGPDNLSVSYARTALGLKSARRGDIESQAINMWRELEASELGSAYSETDRNNALRYIRTLTQPVPAPEWTVDGKYTIEGRLIAGADTERSISALPSDIGILTGYGAIDLFMEDSRLSTDSYSALGFRSLLHYSQFLAACSAKRASKNRGPEQEARYTTSVGHSVGRLVVVTANMQGDLNIKASEYYPFGARDVLGQQQKFAPDQVGEVTLLAHDKAEPGLLKTIMRWANTIKVPERVQLRYFTCAVYEALRIKDKARPFAAENYFGKFKPSHALGLDKLADELAREQGVTQRQSDLGYVAVGSDIVVPGSHSSLNSYVRLKDNSLLMRIDRGYDPKEDEQVPQVVFPPGEMFLLIKALVEQTRKGLGRTSFETMAGIIAYRFSPEFREHVRSAEFYECNSRTAELLARFYDF